MGFVVQNRVAVWNLHTIMIFTLIKSELIRRAFMFQRLHKSWLHFYEINSWKKAWINKFFAKQTESRASKIGNLRMWFIVPSPLIPMLCLRTQFLMINSQSRIIKNLLVRNAAGLSLKSLNSNHCEKSFEGQKTLMWSTKRRWCEESAQFPTITVLWCGNDY